MSKHALRIRLLGSFFWIISWFVEPASGGDLTVVLSRGEGVTLVGAFERWDCDGNPRTPVNPKAKITAPEVTAKAVRQDGNRWVFSKLRAGRYDLVILAAGRVRVEGFHYPPIAEFDPFLPASAQAPQEASDWIVKDIATAQHYENKVTPLFLAGDDKQIRILMQLVRDKETSFDAEFRAPVATVRHEVWQYTNRYGGWVKDRKTKILDRILLPNKEFQRWTWIWEPKLGGIEVSKAPVEVTYTFPQNFDPQKDRGWLP